VEITDRGAMKVGRSDGSAGFLDLREVYSSESRLAEVQSVNAQKAGELLSCFNRAYLLLGDHLHALATWTNEAEAAARKRRAVVVLDEVPRILREKGLSSARSPSGSEDLRAAVLDADAEYSKYQDVLAQLKAAAALLSGKQEGFRRAFGSVKCLVEAEGRTGYGNRTSTATLADTHRARSRGGRTQLSAVETAWGRFRYSGVRSPSPEWSARCHRRTGCSSWGSWTGRWSSAGTRTRR
jgi:hypothetical protein